MVSNVCRHVDQIPPSHSLCHSTPNSFIHVDMRLQICLYDVSLNVLWCLVHLRICGEGIVLFSKQQNSFHIIRAHILRSTMRFNQSNEHSSTKLVFMAIKVLQNFASTKVHVCTTWAQCGGGGRLGCGGLGRRPSQRRPEDPLNSGPTKSAINTRVSKKRLDKVRP